MKVVVGIDVGTNSIGWAILINDEKGVCFIDQAGSRIIPMDATVLGNFDKGILPRKLLSGQGFES